MSCATFTAPKAVLLCGSIVFSILKHRIRTAKLGNGCCEYPWYASSIAVASCIITFILIEHSIAQASQDSALRNLGVAPKRRCLCSGCFGLLPQSIASLECKPRPNREVACAHHHFKWELTAGNYIIYVFRYSLKH